MVKYTTEITKLPLNISYVNFMIPINFLHESGSITKLFNT